MIFKSTTNSEPVLSIGEVRSRLVDRAIIYFMFIAPLAILLSLPRVFQYGFEPIYVFQYFIATVFLALAYFRKQLSYNTRATLLVGLLLVIATTGTFSFGLAGGGPILLVIFCFMVAIAFGTRPALISSLFSLVYVIAIGFAVVRGHITYHFQPDDYVTSLGGWAVMALIFLVYVPGASLSVGVVTESLTASLRNLRETHSLLNSIVDTVPDVIYRLDTNGKIVFISGAVDQYGYTVDELIGTSVIDMIHPDDRESVQNRLFERRSGDRRTKNFEVRFLSKGADFVDSEIRSNMPETVLDTIGLYETGEDGATTYIGSQGTIRDISARKIAENALFLSEEKYHNLYTKTPMMLQGTDSDRRIVSVSDQWLSVLGYTPDEVIGHTITEFLSPYSQKYSHEKLRPMFERDGFITNEPYQYVKKNGEILDLVVSAISEYDSNDIFMQSHDVLVDVTEQKKLEAQIMHSQKMEAVGRLAGGVAHDFNNLLTVIIGHSELALLSLTGNEEIRTDLSEIITTAERAAAVTRQLLTFSRKQIVNIQPIDMNETIVTMGKMLDRLLSEDVSLTLDLSNDIGSIMADQSQIEQIIVNLAVNARDAMPAGGSLKIQTSKIQLPDEEFGPPDDLNPGPYLRLRVSDDGQGMPIEIVEHIFEPFFTTKDASVGTGLGLATVYATIHQIGGAITVESDLSRGTIFEIFLPFSNIETAEDQSVKPENGELRGSETILLVEDNSEILKIVTKVLEGHGYTVISAPDAEVGLEIFNRQRDIDIILTDAIMPGDSGAEMIRQIEEMDYQNPVLFMSGNSEDLIIQRGVLKPGRNFISKPFHPMDLVRKIRTILDERNASVPV